MKEQNYPETLKRWRKARNLSQTVAATIIGVGIDCYRRWEQGISEPAIENQAKIKEKCK